MDSFFKWRCSKCDHQKNPPKEKVCKQCGNLRYKRPADDGWSWIDATVLTRTYLEPSLSPRVAAFDFDNCVFEKKGFHGSPSDSIMFKPRLIAAFKSLVQQDFRIVLFSNEGLYKFKDPDVLERKTQAKKDRLEKFATFIPDIPFEIFVATGKDKHRKPGRGMWDLLKNGSVDPPSFFVGDAAGRKRDHSDSDLKFAQLLNLQFYLPEVFFLEDPLNLIVFREEFYTPPLRIPDLDFQKIVVLMMGFPGAGKTQTAEALFKLDPTSVIRLSQDVLGSKEKVACSFETCLLDPRVKIIIIDRTNINQEQRNNWTCTHYPSLLVQFTADVSTCLHRCKHRINHEGKDFPTDPERIVPILNRFKNMLDTQESTDRHIQIDADIPTNNAVAMIITALSEMKKRRFVFAPISQHDFGISNSSLIATSVMKEWQLNHRLAELVLLEENDSIVEKMEGAFGVGVGCGKYLSRPGENVFNVDLHNEFQGKNIFKDDGTVAQLGQVALLNNNVPFIFTVLGPNTNPRLPDCIADTHRAESLLRDCYIHLFDAFYNKKIYEFPMYQPPPKDSIQSGGFSVDILKRYSEPTLQAELETSVFWRNDSMVVIYDKYPKSKIHLLVIPTKSNPLYNVNGISQLDSSHQGALNAFHQLGADIQNHLGGTNVIRMGYHAIPSLQPLHLHIISNDFQGEYMKKKQHWNSFTHPDFFIHPWNSIGKTVDLDLATAAKVAPIKCCETSFSNMVKLKAHLEESHAIIN